MSSKNKKYYWFKLKDDFFDSKEIRFIREKPSGADMLIVLLKLQLKGLKTGGIIETDGIFDTIEEELAFMISEDKDLVSMSLNFMSKFNLVAKVNATDVNMLLHEDLVGSETASTIRSRKSRSIKKALQCNNGATNCNTEIEIEIEKEIEKEIENKNESIGLFINSLKQQFKIANLGATDTTNIINWCKELNLDPKCEYDKSTYLQGKVEGYSKPTIRMFYKKDTYIKMSNGDYRNREDKTKKKQTNFDNVVF